MTLAKNTMSGYMSDPDRNYMTPAELALFHRMLKAGSLSFYRVGKCQRCGKEIHKAKQFCSKACRTEEIMSQKKPGAWIDAIVEGIQKNFWLETSDGVEREGKITGTRGRTIELNGEPVYWPTEIEINNDSMDTIPLERVVKIKIY